MLLQEDTILLFSDSSAYLLVSSDNSIRHYNWLEDNERNEKYYPFYRTHSFMLETHMKRNKFNSK